MGEKYLTYRPEIDGLRAIAVLAVILFHAEVLYVPGGFVGVDIFFVISGYLITKIIVSQLDAEKFSLRQFYVRRIKRLFPAAFFLILCTLLFGTLMLTPDEYSELSESAFFSSIFLANVFFAKHSGYFDQAAEISPLVHMWSLAVEEQYYLIFPVLLYLIHKKWRLYGVKIMLIVVFLISLTLSMVLSAAYPISSFYLLHTRAWELCLGGLLVLYPMLKAKNENLNSMLSVIGIVLILYGMLFLSRGIAYPTYWALIPTLGAALIITSSQVAGSLSHKLLTQKHLVSIGKFSYSAYLWHWPVVVYYRIYILERKFTFIETVALVVVSLLAGYLSWRFIEEKLRYKTYSNKTVFGLASLSTGIVMATSLLIYLSGGYSSRFSEDVFDYTDRRAMSRVECVEKRQISTELDQAFCVVGQQWSTAKYKGVIWGDSHSLHWAQVFGMLGKQLDIAFVIAPEQCPPYLNLEYVKEFYPKYPTFTQQCTTKHRVMVDWLNSNEDLRFVVMAAAWSGHLRMLYDEENSGNYLNTSSAASRDADVGRALSMQALRKTIDSLDLEGKQVLLLSDIPRPNRSLNNAYVSASDKLLRERDSDSYTYLNEDTVRSWHQYSDDALRIVAAEIAEVDSIILTDKFCENGKCTTFVNSELIYRDSNHIRLNLSPATVSELLEGLGVMEYFSAGLESGS